MGLSITGGREPPVSELSEVMRRTAGTGLLGLGETARSPFSLSALTPLSLRPALPLLACTVAVEPEAEAVAEATPEPQPTEAAATTAEEEGAGSTSGGGG